MTPPPTFDDPDREPLLRGDVEAAHEKIPIGWRGWRYWLHARRLPITVLLALSLFIAGFISHPVSRTTTSDFLREQGGRVLEPWKAWKDPRPGDVERAHDIRVLKGLLQTMYPATHGSPTRDRNWPALDTLSTCIEWANCTNEEKVVIGVSQHFRGGEVGGTGGEDMWARSMLNGFRELNYTFLFTSGHMDTLLVYQKLAPMVQAVIWEPNEFQHCIDRNDTNYLDLEAQEADAAGSWQVGAKACIQSHKFPQGVPFWKSFVLHFWENPVTALGGNWTLSPEDYSKITWNGAGTQFIGYSIGDRCLAATFHEEREHRGLILAKEPKYFDEENGFKGILGKARDTVPPVTVAGEEMPFRLVSTAGERRDDGSTEELPEGIVSLGRMPQEEYTDLLAKSKMLIGIGNPKLSPSPYWALCMGVPFINIIEDWRADDPENRQHWHTQQDALRFTPEPYVYHVRHDDLDGLSRAMQRAAAKQIDRYIPPWMKKDKVLDRIGHLMETDWYAEARRVVEGKYENAPEWQYLAPPQRGEH